MNHHKQGIIFLLFMLHSSLWGMEIPPAFYPLPATLPPPVNEKLILEKANQTYITVYHFEFQKADSMLKELKKEFPNHALPYIATSNYYWWMLISGYDDNITRKLYSDNIDSALSILSRKKKTTLQNDDIYYFAILYSFKARLEMFEKKYLKAVSHFKCSVSY